MGGDRRAPRLSNPLLWTNADKCVAVSVIMFAGIAVLLAIRAVAGDWPQLPSYAHDAAATVDGLMLFGAAVWSVMLVASLLARRRAPGGRGLVLVVVELYAITTAIFLYMAGPFHAPGWMFFLGGSVAGLLVFGQRITFLGVGTFVAVLALVLVAGGLGWLGPLAEGSRPRPMDDQAWSWWALRMGVSSAAFAGVTLAVCAWIIAKLREQSQRLEAMSRTDELTGLTNRRYFMELLNAEMVRARRYPEALACVMFDIDHFKPVNDEHGHLVGDRVLAEVAAVLQKNARASDVVARYGGEEFVMLLPQTSLEGAAELAERCRAAVEAHRLVVDGTPIAITVSAGVGCYESADPARDRATPTTVLTAADDALYRAKAGGRNRVERAPAAAAPGREPRVQGSS